VLAEMQLLQSWRQGDPNALGTILRAYQRRIYGVCVRMLHDQEAAMDLAQESIVRIIEGLPGYDGRSSLSTWMIRVTMNCCLTHLRKQKLRKHQSLDHVGSDEPPRRGELSGPEHVEQGEVREGLVRALSELDPDSRAILVLRDVQGLDYQQVAEVLGVPLGTVKSRIFRAREALRSAIEEAGKPSRSLQKPA
jgi:RNA polymerase sigma-70 factor, ECF subfamily